MFKWLWLIPIAPAGRDRTVNEPQNNNWKLALTMLIAAFIYALIICGGAYGARLSLGKVVDMIGISLIAAAWYGYIGIKNSPVRFKRINWYEDLVFVLAILGTISGFAWLLMGLAIQRLSGLQLGILEPLVTMSMLLLGALALLAGLVSSVVFRGYFLYFLAQLVFIATGCYCFKIVFTRA